MGKELVVSSNRHETKVAVLEDDQLVEVYFQRANEYSLAGSIHKGRVTRVLPGMQSAFVDLGLERDTFLYVSDFFEENEEYDKIGEERPRGDRPERVERPERHERPERIESRPEVAAVVPPSPPAVADVPPGDEVAAAPASAGPPPRTDGGTDDRRGRRSRRRRNRGRGFPDSKYAAAEAGPAPRTLPADTAPEPAEALEAEEPAVEDFSILPGESLAKYSRPSAEELEPEAPAESDESEAPEVVLTAAPAVSETVEPPAPEMPAVAKAVPEPEPVATPVSEPEPVAAAEEPPVEVAAAAEVETETQTDAEAETEAEADVEEFDSDEPEGEEAAEGSEPQSEADAAQEAAERGEVEPARMPQSLTATLREQGGRYMHRGQRRMRRKPRGGTGEPARPQDGAPRTEGRPEGPRNVYRPQDRPQERPERTERSERPERSDRPERPPQTSITELLKEGQEILVQIAKEPLGQKGARITSHIALPGRYVVYMPTVDHMGVSRKIPSDEERMRLKKILLTHRAGVPGGYIVRTAGEGRTEAEIAADMNFLANLWQDIRQKAERRPAPLLLHHDLEIVQRILRDQLTDNFKAIWVDNEEFYESVLRFVQRFQPALVSRVKMYTRPSPIFDAFNISSELEKALRPKVWLKSGGYIVINQTEALVAIDVNTGKYVGKSNRLEDTIVKTNTEAVKEIVRQMRLRDLGGIIVIDFIDMDERKNRQKVMQALEEAMRSDRAPYKVLQFNDFGLVAITRKRVKQSLERTLCAPCPHCEGAGYLKSVQTIIGEILQEAMKIRAAVEDSKDVVLRVHPDVAKVLKSTDNQYLEELEEILGKPVLVTKDNALHTEKFDLA